jgi:glycosyltransferase involved in cell wall biosynthesis
MQLIVLGMHRSGTSALARVLGLMGCHVGADDELAAADESNPKGYWERRDVWALNERLLAAAGASWHDVGGFDVATLDAGARADFERDARAVIAGLDAHRPWAVKDPRTCLTFPLWRDLLERPVCVLIQRDPLEVARSLQRRDGFALVAGIALWEIHVRGALRHSAGLPRALVRYEALCADPRATVEALLRDLEAAGLPPGTLSLPPEGELRAFLDPALHRQQAAPGEVLEYLNPAQRALLERLQGGAALAPDDPGPLSGAARDALDALARERRGRAGDVRLLEGLIAEKDAYARTLQEQLAEERRLGAARPALLSAGAAGAAPRDWSDSACCTIVSRNYLSLARACCCSFLDHHPGARAFVLIADTPLGVDAGAESFECLAADAVGIPNFDDFAFKYNILELNTAVKPFFLERLFERAGIERLFYLDPDIFVFGPLLEARAALEAGQIALTPHILAPIPTDGRRPQERELLQSGAYNLGFLALRRSDETRTLLHWWQHRLYEGAYSDPARGMFTDQKWMDLVPGLHRGVVVLRHPGCNAAYWNLHERGDLTRDEAGAWCVNGQPLRFFHFSGFDKRQLERVSKHQDRFRLSDLPPAFRTLFGDYARALDAHGWAETHALPYAYASFDNGARVPDFARRLYAELGPERRRFGNPFEAAGEGSFFSWLTRPATPDELSPLLMKMRAIRADLVQAFPDPAGRDRRDWLEWVCAHAAQDFGLGEPYLTHFREARDAVVASLERAARNEAPAAPPPEPIPAVDLGALRPKRAWKRALREVVGAGAYDRARRRVWAFYYWLGARFGLGPSAPGRAPAPVPAEDLAPPEPAPRAFDRARPFGVNLFGYFDTESGVGEIARGLAAMLRAADVPHALVNVEQDWLRRGDRRVRDFSSAHPYAIDLLAVNADQAPHVARAFGLRPGDGRYRIGYWFWELSRLPPALAASGAGFHELWVASDFCREAVAAATRVPTVKLTPALVAAPAGRSTRADFGFGHEFVCLFVFDAASVVKRKNPGALISAFRRAFRPDEPARLVLKTVNLAPRLRAALERLAGDARVELRNGYVPHGEVLDLLAACDAYVSLHRSEGLGLTLLDALLLGKPVVATPYSGVTEFLDGPGTFPVAHRLVELKRDFGPYPRGAEWAEPDVADAARRLREVYELWRAGRSRDAGQAEALRRRYSPATTAVALRARLEAVRASLESRAD